MAQAGMSSSVGPWRSSFGEIPFGDARIGAFAGNGKRRIILADVGIEEAGPL